MNRSGRSRTPFVIAIVLVLVAALALVAVLLSGGDDEAVETPVTTAGAGGSNGATDDAGTGAGAPTTAGDDAAPAGQVDPLAAVVDVEGAPLAVLEDPDADDALGIIPPTLRGTDYSGNPVEIVPGSGGRPKLVVVLAHWCPHCNAEVPRLIEWRDSGEIPATLDVVAISTAANPERPNYPPGEWLAGEDWQWPVLADDTPTGDQSAPSALDAYGVSAFPFFTLLDADGRVVARRSGEIPIDELAQLVAGVA
ncbi:MAG: TlpA family protein disulfide reductase [Actinomycetota bacterium]|nr:TlpA family protein disulfide reductase [Actinomycetota bacterium]